MAGYVVGVENPALGGVACPVLENARKTDEACVGVALPAGTVIWQGMIVVESFVAWGCLVSETVLAVKSNVLHAICIEVRDASVGCDGRGTDQGSY